MTEPIPCPRPRCETAVVPCLGAWSCLCDCCTGDPEQAVPFGDGETREEAIAAWDESLALHWDCEQTPEAVRQAYEERKR